MLKYPATTFLICDEIILPKNEIFPSWRLIVGVLKIELNWNCGIVEHQSCQSIKSTNKTNNNVESELKTTSGETGSGTGLVCFVRAFSSSRVHGQRFSWAKFHGSPVTAKFCANCHLFSPYRNRPIIQCSAHAVWLEHIDAVLPCWKMKYPGFFTLWKCHGRVGVVI